MIKRDVSSFFCENWTEDKKTVTELSKNKRTQYSLVQNEKKLYDFDDIKDKIYASTSGTSLKSVDAVWPNKNKVYFIEFKTGFKKKINKDNFDKNKMICDETHKYCNEYGTLFLKLNDKEIDELISSIHSKAIESYITFEKHIFPKCEVCNQKIKLIYIAVIDADSIDKIEDIYTELGKTKPASNNYFQTIKNSLKAVVNKKDCNNEPYFYDEAKVMSVDEFNELLSNG